MYSLDFADASDSDDCGKNYGLEYVLAGNGSCIQTKYDKTKQCTSGKIHFKNKY